MIDPVRHDECAHLFCYLCSSQVSDRCPCCRTDKVIWTRVERVGIMIRLLHGPLDSLKVQCKICDGKTERYLIDKHVCDKIEKKSIESLYFSVNVLN